MISLPYRPTPPLTSSSTYTHPHATPLFHSGRYFLPLPLIPKHSEPTWIQSSGTSPLAGPCPRSWRWSLNRTWFLTQRVSQYLEGGGGHRCINKAPLASKNKNLLKVIQAQRVAYWKEMGFLRTQRQTAKLGFWELGIRKLSESKAILSASPACTDSASASSFPLPELAASLHTHFAPGTNSISWPPLCPRSPPLGNGLCADTTQNLEREDLLGLDLLCLLRVLSLAVEPMGPWLGSYPWFDQLWLKMEDLKSQMRYYKVFSTSKCLYDLCAY